MATKAFLIGQILNELGIWESGQDLPPEDYRKVEEGLLPRLLAMGRAQIYTVDDVNNVPDDAVVEVARYLAGEYAITFGLEGEELQVASAAQAASEQALRFLRTRGPTFVRQRAEYI
jgi:hypothetical protein